MARKSSHGITLVLIGVAALAGCSEQKRDMYATREDCLADWANKPEDCVPANPSSPGRGGGVYYGPSYAVPWWRSSSGFHAGSSSRAVSSVPSSTVSRGGFGSTARGFSSGG